MKPSAGRRSYPLDTGAPFLRLGGDRFAVRQNPVLLQMLASKRRGCGFRRRPAEARPNSFACPPGRPIFGIREMFFHASAKHHPVLTSAGPRLDREMEQRRGEDCEW